MKRVLLIVVWAAMIVTIAMLSEAVLELTAQIVKQRAFIEGGCR